MGKNKTEKDFLADGQSTNKNSYLTYKLKTHEPRAQNFFV